MDMLLLRRLLLELERELPGCRLEQVYAIPRHHLALTLSLPGRPRLWFSAEPEEPHLYLRPGGHDAPARPPGFAMAVRKVARGRAIEEIGQVGDDRIVELRFRGAGERLLFELIARRAAAYLLDADARVTAVWMPRRGRPGPGETYRPPERPPRRTPPQIRPAEWRQWAALEERALRRRLVAEIAGMTPLIAREVLARGGRADSLPDRVEAELWRATAAPTRARVQMADGVTPATDERAPLALAPYPLCQFAGTSARGFPSLVAAAAFYYPARARARWLRSARAALAAAIRAARVRCARALERIDAEAASADPDALRHRADLLLAFPDAPREGDSILLPDIDGSGELLVPLAPRRGPIEQAQHLYRRARRQERARQHARRRRRELNRRIEQLRALELRVTGGDPREFGGWEQQAARLGVTEWTRPPLEPEAPRMGAAAETRARRSRHAPAAPAGVLEVEVAGGYRVWIGRSAAANERLTRRLARRHDWWLHAEGPGSHVVLRNPRRLAQPPPEALAAAAALAAWFSKARRATAVEVRWARLSEVRQPKGAPPGRVVLGRYRTLLVRPRPPAAVAAPVAEGDSGGREAL